MVGVVTDEHVPRVFINTLRSSGHRVSPTKEVLGEATPDRALLEFCGREGQLLVTHDKKDFTGELVERVDHAGIVIYTDQVFLRDDPDGAVRTFDRIVSALPRDAFENEVVWFEQWRE